LFLLPCFWDCIQNFSYTSDLKCFSWIFFEWLHSFRSYI
jgi:hypothetical protein